MGCNLFLRLAAAGLALALCGCASESPEARLQAAIDAMGSDDALTALGSVVLAASGTLDKAAEGQAFSPRRPSPAPYEETLAVDLAGTAALWDYHEERYDGTTERFGESYAVDGQKLLLIHSLGIAVPLRSPAFGEDRARVRRRLPHVMLRELLSSPERLALVEPDARIRGTLEDGTVVEVALDPETRVVRELAYEQILPGRGPVTLRWWYEDYEEIAPGVSFPMRYGSRVGELAYTEMRVDEARAGGPELFAAPDGLRVLDARDSPPDAEPAELERRELSSGVYVVPDVRSGFAPLVVELDDGLVVVDAPASFPMLGQLPAGETDPAPSMSWHSERLVSYLGEAWPDKPVRYVVLTHHHEDHAGGVRAFVAAGATVLGPASAVDVARRLVELPEGAVGDRLASAPREASYEVVDSARGIGAGPRRVELLPVGDNPHADGMLVISVPEAEILYVSDLLTPGPLESYPRDNHRPLDEFFAGWLDGQGLDPDAVWSMHGADPVTREHLERLRAATPER